MSKRYPRAKWTLPATVDPSGSVCYTVPVPNERFHIAAFLGALQDLGSAAQWADDEAHTAKDVAQVWRDIIDELEKEVCSGCKHTNGEFHDPLEPGQTVKFSVTVEAGEFQILPILLFADQTLTISKMVGQWRDSQYHPDMECTSNWETPLGVVINAASGLPADTFITDVMPEISHMKLIMRVNNCGILTYHDLDDPISYTVPDSVSLEGVFVEFLPNVPVDGNNEIAAGFLGYGMVCFEAIVTDANFCPQVFINFEPASLELFTLIAGEVVETSPIDEGAALFSEDGPSETFIADIIIPVDDCTVGDFAFTYRLNFSGVGVDFDLVWETLDIDDNVITSGTEDLPVTFDVTVSETIDAGNAPNVASVRLKWIMANADSGSGFWIDNVFIN